MKKQIVVLSFTEQGFELAKKIREALIEEYRLEVRGESGIEVILYRKGSVFEVSGVRNAVDVPETKDTTDVDAIFVTTSLRDWCADVFAQSSALIFVGAAGIAVRTIAPFLVSKEKDPAVLVADEQGKHVISLLSGHLGGGNELTLFLAKVLGADPVITTASDVGGKLAIDVWAQKNHLYITDLKAAKSVAARIVDGMAVPFYCEGRVLGEIPPELVRVEPVKRGSELVRVEPVKKGSESVQAEFAKWGQESVQTESVKSESDVNVISLVQVEEESAEDKTAEEKTAAGRSSLTIARDSLVYVSVSEPLRNLPESVSGSPWNLPESVSEPLRNLPEFVSGPLWNLPESVSEPLQNLSDLISEPVKLSAQPDVSLRLKRNCTMLHLVPRAVVLGIGCKKGKSTRDIRDFVFDVLKSQRIVPQSITAVASIDLKSGEAGLLDLAAELDVPFQTFSAEELQAVPGEYSSSGFVSSVTGVDNVCERAAMAALTGEEQKKAHFLCRKTVGNGVTVAMLEKEWEVSF